MLSSDKELYHNDITPMMKQYREIKERYPGSILFFRLGDFYEMFDKDAIISSKLLDITLTSRNKNKSEVPMCGVPYHSAHSYILKLINNGFKVAICEQIEDPKLTKGIVKREVVRVITPGTIIDSNFLDAKECHYLAGFSFLNNRFGLAVIDLSTGDFFVYEYKRDEINKMADEIKRLSVKEILISNAFADSEYIKQINFTDSPLVFTGVDEDYFDYSHAYTIITGLLGVKSLEGFGCESMKSSISSAGAVIRYIKEMQRKDLKHIKKIYPANVYDYMHLDEATFKNMEILKDNEGFKRHSLLNILDVTITPMGARTIKSWVSKPLVNIEEINKRQELVSSFVTHDRIRGELRQCLSTISDMERIIGRISLMDASPVELIELKQSIYSIPKVIELINEISSLLHFSKGIQAVTLPFGTNCDDLLDIAAIIDNSIEDEPPISVRYGMTIKNGFSTELDELRRLLAEGKDWIRDFELRERLKIGIQSLKVRFNKVYGYYIEVTHKNASLVPASYIRKQSLVNCERFISQELKEYETKVFSAEERIDKIETALFEEILNQISLHSQRIQKTANQIAVLDALISLAEIAVRNRYVRPEINDKDVIHIIKGRHPVIELMNRDEPFVPNDIFLDREANNIAIVTGPNMAGKSTYLRQIGLIVIMAQIGSFVPADKAIIGVVDRVFTRVGAYDNLVRGQSTFMVEMNETANILNNATSNSLIIMDEIGRGTSTFDGISIAWSIVEYIKKSIGAKTIFATHYFELTELEDSFKGIKNLSINVKECDDKIIFLRTISESKADKSYGIYVGKLAGLPPSVIATASEILHKLESGRTKDIYESKGLNVAKDNRLDSRQLNLFNNNYLEAIEHIKSIDLDNISAITALNELYKIQTMLKEALVVKVEKNKRGVITSCTEASQ